MASFFHNVLKPYEGHKLDVYDYLPSEQYTKNIDKIKPRIIASLSSQAFNELTMQFKGTVYVFSENELKELLKNR